MITQIKKHENNDVLTEKIIGCCYKIHSELGPGFNEKIYHNALELGLEQINLKYNTEKRYNVYYQAKKVGSLILDLVIEDKIIVEIKAIAGYVPAVFNYQVLSYLRASGLKIALLINFGNKSCQVKRFIN